jgi:death-on-curing family protein
MTPEKSKNPKIWLDIPLCKTIYEKFRKLQAKNKFGEPIPPFDTRYPDRLESLIESVKLKSNLLSLDVYHVGASYYVNLAKSQVFLNGNKRMAVILTSIFFELNGYKEGNTSWIDLADLTLLVSEDRVSEKDKIIESVARFFKLIYGK